MALATPGLVRFSPDSQQKNSASHAGAGCPSAQEMISGMFNDLNRFLNLGQVQQLNNRRTVNFK